MKITLTRKQRWLLPCLALASMGLNAQISFTNGNSLLHSDAGTAGSNGNNHSGVAVTVADMNNDGLDDICKLDENRYVRIEYQQPGGTFTYQYAGDMGTADAWSMVCGDVDRNGYKDVLVGEGNSLVLMKLDASGSMGLVTLPSSNFFQQNLNFMDVNNDGWIDVFACDDDAYAKIYLNDGAGNFPAEANNTVINLDVTPGQNTGTSNDDSGNYGSVWTDFDNDGDVDLYIAHCRQSVSSGTDPRRIDKLFVNNGGTFTEQAATYGVASGDQDWTSTFGDIDNDGDFDLLLTKHNVSSKLYINDGTGHYTASNTLAFGNMPMQAQFEDFDNDGYVDIIMSGDNDYRIYQNSGSGTFTDVTPSNLTAGSNFLSFATGDLNHDGKIDFYASYGSTYTNPSGSQDDIYWQNSTNNGNHFITLVLSPTNSNHDALGARAFVYGPWGVQTREVRAGESYGTMNTGLLHFGLGASTAIDSIVVNWPSGAQNVFTNPAADQFLGVYESNQCAISNVIITPSGPTNLCTGGNVTLTAPSGGGYAYLWSTGATTQSINVASAGSYMVQVTQSPGCIGNSTAINVTMNADETPSVTASSSDLTFCQGQSVTLTSSPASSYLWSNGATTQSIVVTASGNYSVTIQGACQAWTSAATAVTVNAAPAIPTGSDVYISSAQSVTLTATGSNDVWFDAPSGGNQLATGNNYVTPVIISDTTFYVEDQSAYGGSNVYGGMTYHAGSNYSGNTTNAYLIFDVMAACTLNTVKVYTDSPGNRLIELRDNGGTVLNSIMVNIPVDTSVITLNFPLAVGNGYQLGTNTSQNITLLGSNSPRLERSNTNVSYPYNISGLCSITGSQQGAAYYYYFYDWNVTAAPMICPSPRHPQSVKFNTGIRDNEKDQLFALFPNPAGSTVNIRMKAGSEESTLVTVTNMLGQTVNAVTVGAVKRDQVINLDLKDLTSGIYFITLKQQGKTSARRLVVE